ncbi:XdhC family protein [Saccharopolyspora cebuensis]|uniref:XdhC family protein n=1 Tax=Saccharopolyspora cebuensis TaxID=418759 RepID=A0ABV4CS22_9PSEU
MIDDSACGVAHGGAADDPEVRVLVAVFASPVSGYLLRYARDAGFRPVLVEPDAGRAAEAAALDVPVVASMPELDGSADVVVTDHHRPELGPALRDALAGGPRWIGVMGNPRHRGPHVEALRELGVGEAEILTVHRPIGLNIGSRRPAEIAVATLAGLLADRNGKPGGFEF